MAKKNKSAKKTAAKKTVKKAAKKSTPKKSAKKAVKKSAPKKKPAPKKALKSKKPDAPKTTVMTRSISPYLTFPGNCEEAFNFYKSVFGGEFPYLGRFKDMPPSDDQPMPESEGNKIMHVSLPIGGNTVLMGSDSSEAFGHATIMGNNFSISLTATSQAEADKLYSGLSEGGTKTMPMNKTFWGSYFGMLTDKFGIQWMVSFDEKPGQQQ
jgi:PhnB protein